MNPSLSIETATQLAVFLANRPGALARVCEALAKAEINIHALATSDTVDHTVVRMVVSDPTKALIASGRGGNTGARDRSADDRNRRANQVSWRRSPSASAEAEVNIEYAYLAGGRAVEKGLIVLRPSDVRKSEACPAGFVACATGASRHSYHERDAGLGDGTATAGRAVGRTCRCTLRGESRSSCHPASHARVPRSLHR